MVGGSLRVLPTSSTTKTGRHDIAEYCWKWRYTPKIKINQSNPYDVPFVKSALNFTVLAQKLLSKKIYYY